MTNLRRRRIVEIYFVLYLAALVLLIPGSRDDDKQYNGKGTLNFLFPFTLLPEKTTLTCRLKMDSTSPRIISLDSINTIFYTGDVTDVKFEFIVEDKSLHQRLNLTVEDNSITKYFRIEEHPDRQAATFTWFPPLTERQSKNYLVTVIATAHPRLGSKALANADKESISSQSFKVKTQFSLNMIYIDDPNNAPFSSREGIAQNIPFDARSLIDNPPYQSMLKPNISGGFGLSVPLPLILKTANHQWNTTLTAYNINLQKDIKDEPEIKITCNPPENNGAARIANIKDDRIELIGIVPSQGSMKVSVKVRRKYDNSETTADFTVKPQLYDQPDIPKRMYQDGNYVFDPKFPLTTEDVKAYLKDGNLIKSKSEDGEKFFFATSAADTGREFTFERYIGGILYDKYKIKVYGFDAPLVKDIQSQGNGKVWIVTHSYGTYNAGNGNERNLVEKLEFNGNAHLLRERYGNYSKPSDMTNIQYWEVVPNDPSQPFNFNVTAIDHRGRKSQPKSYRQP